MGGWSRLTWLRGLVLNVGRMTIDVVVMMEIPPTREFYQMDMSDREALLSTQGSFGTIEVRWTAWDRFRVGCVLPSCDL